MVVGLLSVKPPLVKVPALKEIVPPAVSTILLVRVWVTLRSMLLLAPELRSETVQAGLPQFVMPAKVVFVMGLAPTSR